MLTKTGDGTEPAIRLENIKSRIAKLNQSKLEAQAQLTVLSQQKEAKLRELSALGITDLSKLSVTIAEQENILNQQLTYLEDEVTKLEAFLLGGQ